MKNEQQDIIAKTITVIGQEDKKKLSTGNVRGYLSVSHEIEEHIAEINRLIALGVIQKKGYSLKTISDKPTIKKFFQ